MQSVGTILAILNDNLLVVKADETLADGSTLTVFARIPTPPLVEHGITAMDFPKGKLQVLSSQATSLYLARRFRITDDKTTALDRARTAGSLMSSLFFEEAEWSAVLDKEASLKIGMDTTVRIGDHVGK